MHRRRSRQIASSNTVILTENQNNETSEGPHSESLWDADRPLRNSTWPRQMSSELCTSESSSVRTRRRILRFFATATRSCRRNGRLKSTMRLDNSPLRPPGIHGGQFGASCTQRRPVQNRTQKSARHCVSSTPWSAPWQPTVHPGDDTRFFYGRPLAETTLGTRLAAVIDRATSTYLEALDGDDQAAAKLYVQKPAQAADEAWQETVDGHNGPANPTVSELEHPSAASRDDDSDDTDIS